MKPLALCTLIIGFLPVSLPGLTPGEVVEQDVARLDEVIAVGEATPEWELPPTATVDIPGFGTVRRMSSLIYTGPIVPDADNLPALKRHGIATILSIDPVAPDGGTARPLGIYTIHVPMRYGAVDSAEEMFLVRALSYFKGPYYIHAASGEDRMLAAAALGAQWLERRYETLRALHLLVTAGVSETRTDLYAGVLGPSRKIDFEMVTEEMPYYWETAVRPASLQLVMQRVGRSFDVLRQMGEAGWRIPSNLTATTPATEAAIIADTLRHRLEADPSERPYSAERMAEAVAAAEALAKAFEGDAANPTVTSAWNRLKASCMDCHAESRDAPH